jgi:hypothetical protein
MRYRIHNEHHHLIRLAVVSIGQADFHVDAPLCIPRNHMVPVMRNG